MKIPILVWFLLISIGLMFLLYTAVPAVRTWWTGTEGFTNTLSFERHYIMKDEYTEAPPYGYENDPNNSDQYRSIFRLEMMPDTGVPYGHAPSADGKFIIPTSDSTIYSAIARSQMAIVGTDNFDIDLIVYHDGGTEKFSNSTVINKYFQNTNDNLKWKDVGLNWSIQGHLKSWGDLSNYNFQNLRSKEEIKRNPNTVHLILVRKPSGNDTSEISVNTDAEKTPMIIYKVGTKDIFDTSYQSGNTDVQSLEITRALCQVLGLSLDDNAQAGVDFQNIMYNNNGGPLERDITGTQIQIMRDKGAMLPNSYTPTDTSTQNQVSEELQEVLDKVEERTQDYKDNYFDNIQYHKTEEEIRAESKEDNTGVAYVIGQDGKRVALPKISTQPNQLFYTAGSYPFGSANYVPKYEDSVYLSKLTGESMALPLENTAAMKGGFCTQEKHNPLAIDQKCQQMDKDKCASTTCCVLLGGAKCVGGSQGGPTLTGHYSDVTIRDRDFYYYQGKCYGNCPEHNPF